MTPDFHPAAEQQLAAAMKIGDLDWAPSYSLRCGGLSPCIRHCSGAATNRPLRRSATTGHAICSRLARTASAAFQPLEKDVILNVVCARALISPKSNSPKYCLARSGRAKCRVSLGLSMEYLEISVHGIVIPDPDNEDGAQ
jgi:hypothetical protein